MTSGHISWKTAESRCSSIAEEMACHYNHNHPRKDPKLAESI